jgi:ribonuclease P protein component
LSGSKLFIVGPVSSFSFPRTSRLLSQRDFDAMRDGTRLYAAHFIFIIRARPDLEASRLGLSVSRKVGSAPVRARTKRCVREAFRLGLMQLSVPIDLLVIARHSDAAKVEPTEIVGAGRMTPTLVAEEWSALRRRAEKALAHASHSAVAQHPRED